MWLVWPHWVLFWLLNPTRVLIRATVWQTMLAMIRMTTQSLRAIGGMILRVGLVLGLLLISQVTVGQVLCIGTEGHIALESAGHGSCTDELLRAEHHVNSDHSSHTHMTEDHCGTCVDIEMDGQIITTHTRPAGADFGHLIDLTDALKTSHIVSRCNCVSSDSDRASWRSPPYTMLCLRSTVLLI